MIEAAGMKGASKKRALDSTVLTDAVGLGDGITGEAHNHDLPRGMVGPP
ncbi:MAG: hypothetical protein M0Z29_10060 [Actinomycetota bacterium]|nr:hypothetical protein [Actinomycetota bacterium]